MLKLSNNFRMTIINTLKDIVEKVNSMHDYMGNFKK